jgi:hypothetical protein
MADIVDVRAIRRLVIEFLTAESTRPIEIHRCMRSLYDEDATNVS